MKKPLITKLAALAVACVGIQVSAQTFNADAGTGVDGGANFTINTNRLFAGGFIGSVTNTRAATNTVMWFVVDTLNNGIPTNTYNPLGTLLGFGPGGVLGADDQILWLDSVDGTRAGTQPGQFRRTITLNNAFATSDVYLFLWSFTNSPVPGTFGSNAPGFTVPVGGDTLGVWKIGQVAAPPVGNAVWQIGNTFNDQYIIPGAVPEPTTIALGAMGAIGAFVLYRRRRS